MFSRSAHVYDAIYRSFKNYEGECAKIHDVLSNIQPRPNHLLDIACGTGEHAKILCEQYGYKIDGLDLDRELVEIAQSKNPDGKFYCEDMSSFNLENQYDAVLCLFSSIGYLKTEDRIQTAFACFRSHLKPGGIVVVEPWFTPDQWKPGSVSIQTVETDQFKVCRMSFSERDTGCLSKFRFEYLIGSPEGIRHEVEHHELGLLTVEQMLECFKRSGLAADYDPVGISGRGLYVATVPEKA